MGTRPCGLPTSYLVARSARQVALWTCKTFTERSNLCARLGAHDMARPTSSGNHASVCSRATLLQPPLTRPSTRSYRAVLCMHHDHVVRSSRSQEVSETQLRSREHPRYKALSSCFSLPACCMIIATQCGELRVKRCRLPLHARVVASVVMLDGLTARPLATRCTASKPIVREQR